MENGSKPSWYFPPTSGGIENGPSDADIETFNGNPIESLGREICQNSLDANRYSDKPTVVEFTSFTLNAAEVKEKLGLDSFPQSAVLMKSSHIAQEDKKTKLFLDKLSQTVSGNTNIRCMKISDHNTIGLQIKPDETGRDSAFHIFTKTRGKTEKYGSEGGSYGIGRNVIFALSDIRMVFVSTVDSNSDAASLGIIKMMTFTDEDGEKYQGCGFYGIEHDRRKGDPIDGQFTLAGDNKRDQKDSGLDIYIIGFNGPVNWYEELTYRIIDNFFYALHNEKLIVKIKHDEKHIIIDKNSIETTLQRLIDLPQDNDTDETRPTIYEFTYDFYKAIQNHGPDTLLKRHKILEEDDIFFYINKKPNVRNRRVARIRKIGMKVYDELPRRVGVNLTFAGVLLVKGEKLNAIIKQTENVSHTAWQPERIKDEKDRQQADTILQQIKRIINDDINELLANETKNGFDPLGGAFLLIDPDPTSDTEETIDYKNKYLKSTVSQISKPKIAESKKIDGQLLSEFDFETDSNNDDNQTGYDSPTKDKIKKISGGTKGNAPIRANRIITRGINSSKVFNVTDSDKGKYSLYITSATSSAPCCGGVEIKIAGETMDDKAEILEALIDGQKPVIYGNLITNITFTQNVTIEIKLTIKSDQLIPIEAYAYETEAR